MSRLSGKVALVTGAARGIGAGVALAFAREGAAAVVVNDLTSTADVESTLQNIADTGAQACFLAADVRSEEQVDEMFRQVVERFGRLDILVNNAGITRREDIFETSLEGWHAVLDTHLTGTFLCARAAMRIMREQRCGRIIQMSSVLAWQAAVRGFVHYAAAKGGQIAFTHTLSKTAAPFGITVNAIAPGVIETEMLRQAHGEAGIAEVAKQIPLGLGSVEDVAAAAVFLASDESKHITGATIDVNGGYYYR
ncbi:SDR family NAD(P)-dependent oxidoreductase [uncultured Paludibaculum sp.]|uniref:SDR family NAD(P)-dependent oxidoreductase n=1 Tax=uncultured Paludibaculum sp. TaxID=1765020 RepID=UPI002AAB33DA|nr:SDR family NAD(P)-dependent oxidoreductase [uncultured Paludibaculum sp.]